MRLEPRTVLSVGVFAAAVLAVMAAVSLRLLRTATEREQDALSEAVAMQEMLMLDTAPMAPIAEIGHVVRELPKEACVAETMEILHTLAERAQIALTSCAPVPANPAGSERGRIRFAATGHADGRALCDFLARVETHDRLFAFASASFRPTTLDRIGFELTILAFHEEGER